MEFELGLSSWALAGGVQGVGAQGGGSRAGDAGLVWVPQWHREGG